MKSYKGEDGRWHHRFRQSWLKTALQTCLERSRREHAKTLPEWETDAACIGTAMHAAIEGTIAAGGLPLWQTLELWDEAWEALVAQENFRWIKYKPNKAREFGHACTLAWHELVLPTLSLDDCLTEWQFGKPEDGQALVTIVDTDERVIDLSGTVDYVDSGTILDWKTSSRGPYVPWEQKRWAVQPTVYCFAHEQAFGVPAEFEFVVMDGSDVQRLPIQRGPEHYQWLGQQCNDLAKLIEMELPVWPTNDAHALCSAKWCPAWDTCKGATGITF